MIEHAVRAAAPAILAVFVVIGTVPSQLHPAVIAIAAISTVTVGAVVAWRGLTGWPLVAALAAPAVGLIVICYPDAANIGWFGMCLLAGWAALRADVVPAVTAGAALVLVFFTQALMIGGPGWAAWMAGIVFTTTACMLTRRQRQLTDRLREAQAGLAARARAEERNRIASEMHDVIGHALTVCILHMSSARLALDDDPEESRDSLTEAERLARSSLEEVRATVGLLRSTDSHDALPQPSGADLPELVESFRRTGTQVELEVRGDSEALGTGRGLAVYRIVQESLTNAARHGDGTPVHVHLNVENDVATVTVNSGGVPRHVGDTGAGLIVMRERAESLGGQLRAGPTTDGWRTTAVLPS